VHNEHQHGQTADQLATSRSPGTGGEGALRRPIQNLRSSCLRAGPSASQVEGMRHAVTSTGPSATNGSSTTKHAPPPP
jgi:hypothetical protein